MEGLLTVLRHALRKRSVLIFAIATTLAMVAYDSNGRAQSGAGSIQGTVTDSTGAVIAGASIHVVNQDTSVTTDTISNSVGFYQVPSLFTGTYSITVTAQGMETYKRTVELLVNQSAVINPSLVPGAVTQQVQVVADTVQLTTLDSGIVASTLENSRINQLPMNGRNILSLTGETTPGLEGCSQNPGGACANGLMGEAMEYVADGVSASNREYGGEHSGSVQLPDPDAIQEVHVETSGVSAQYATPAAGVITTKSGTNQLHGTMFETARNNAWGIAKARQNPSNYAAPRYIRNEFGASAGGPIILPHIYHGKNKSFWFFAYERFSLASFANEDVSVPTPAMRQGDFSQLTNSSGVLQTLFDPSTTQSSASCPYTNAANPYCRTPFLNNQIPIGRLSPTAKILFDITPQPSSSANPLVHTNLTAIDPTEYRIPSITFRLDHAFNESNRAYLRYTGNVESESLLTNQPSNQPATIAADGLPANASGQSVVADDMFAGAIGYTHVFSPTFFSETVVSQQWWGEQNTAGGTPNADFEQKLGTPNNFGEAGFPYFETIIDPIYGTQTGYGESQIIDNLDENLTKVVGRHQMLFGGRYRHERFGMRPNQNQDTINFAGLATGLENPATNATNSYSAFANTGNANADMFLGAANSYLVNLEPPYNHLHDMEFDAYFQDNYHVTRNLTLNIGLRYEAHPAPWTKYGLRPGFDLKNDALVTAAPVSQLIAEGYTTQALITNIQNDGGKIETAQQAGLPPNTLVKNYDFTLGPRVGVAWQPFGKYGTVLRGAYGRYIYPVPTFSYLNNPTRNVPFVASYTMSYAAANQSPDGLPNYLLRHQQPVVMGVNSSNAVDSSSTTSLLPNIAAYNIDPDYAPDYVTNVNLTIEQPMKGNSALRVSYVYTHGTNLDQRLLYNNHLSSYAWEMETGTTPPNGGASTIGTSQYAASALGPYDNVTWGSGDFQEQKTGWSNDNQLQVNYQRLFHRGIAYQITYDWSKPFRLGGDANRQGEIYPAADYVNSGLSTMSPDYGPVGAVALPPPVPPGTASWAYYRALNRFENYMVDTQFPIQHILFNGIVDLPFGRGKRILGNANRFLDEVVGGFQLAGAGSIHSQSFTVTATHWGATNPIHVYKHKMPITDCRSGVCYKEFEWFNGYLAPTVTTDCTKSCVAGLPSNWAPYQTPIVNDPTSKYYGQDDVDITLPGGKPSEIAFAPSPSTSSAAGVGSNPFSHTVLNGPMNWSADISIFKVFPITERVNLRFNMDAFNAFNVQGYTNPSATDGTEQVQPGGVGATSYNAARQIQFTLRLTF